MGNSYSEDNLINIFLDKIHQCGKYTAQIASHQEELRREKNFTDQKYLSISSLHTEYYEKSDIIGFFNKYHIKEGNQQ